MRVLAAAAIVVAALLVGMSIGVEVGKSLREPPGLEYCALPGSHGGGTPPCPPEVNTLVWAIWSPGIEISAIWDGNKWIFTQSVMGVRETSTPPIEWYTNDDIR